MNWLIRYLLGLPARKQDVEELKANLPELIAHPEKLKELDYPFFIHPKRFAENDFKKWISESAELERNNDTSLNECPFSNCPLKEQQNTDNSSENDLLELMTIGGHSKTPKASFFDLVKKVHKKQKNIRKIILTDPYILSDVSEDGQEGGLSSFIEYLKIIVKNTNAQFDLLISPTLKKQSKELHEEFRKNVKETFRNVNLSTYKSDYKFHDRLMLVKDDSGNWKGIFGPSFNGLNSNSIVLYGELETKRTMEKLVKWIDK